MLGNRLFTLADPNISIVAPNVPSNPNDPAATLVLLGLRQGEASDLQDMLSTLNLNAWQTVDVFDDDANFNDSKNGLVLDAKRWIKCWIAISPMDRKFSPRGASGFKHGCPDAG